MAGQELARFDPIVNDTPLAELLRLYKIAILGHIERKKERRELRNLGTEDQEYIDAQYAEDTAEALVNLLDKAIMINMYLGKREKYG